MKRSISDSDDQAYAVPDVEADVDADCCKMKKKIRRDRVPETEAVTDETSETPETPAAVLLDENLLYEVLKHVDARTLGAVACVNKQWHRTAEDERLWELICTKHWANIGCGNNQLRSVVLALGGFRRLHSHYLWPLSKPSISTATSSSSSTVAAAASSSAWPCLPPPRTIVPSKPTAAKTRWGKDEILGMDLLVVAEGVFGWEALKSPTVSEQRAEKWWVRCGGQRYKQMKTMVECRERKAVGIVVLWKTPDRKQILKNK